MPSTIDRHGVQRLVEAGAQLVDVLPPKDYEGEHLPARSIFRSNSSTARRPPDSTGINRSSSTVMITSET